MHWERKKRRKKGKITLGEEEPKKEKKEKNVTAEEDGKKEKKEKKSMEENMMVTKKVEEIPQALDKVSRSPSAQTLRMPDAPSLKKTKSFGSNMLRKRPSFGKTPIITENTNDATVLSKKDKTSEMEAKKNKIFLRKISGLIRDKKENKKSPKKNLSSHTSEPLRKKTPIDWNQRVLFAHDGSEEFKYDDLQTGDCIGMNRYGPVFLVSKYQQESVLRLYIKSELKHLPTHLFVYNHPFLVKTLYIYHDKSKIFYLFERIHGIHFLEFFQKKESGSGGK